MPVYEFGCEKCSHQWEDYFKTNDPLPKKCPDCNSKKIKKLISWCRGKVELTGKDLVKSLWAEGKKMARDARKDENLLANLVGETKYNNNELARTKK